MMLLHTSDNKDITCNSLAARGACLIPDKPFGKARSAIHMAARKGMAGDQPVLADSAGQVSRKHLLHPPAWTDSPVGSLAAR